MKYSPTIQVLISLAADESINTEYQEIRVEHFFCAILKYSKLSVEEIDILQHSPEEQIASELKAVNTLLQQNNIDTEALYKRVHLEIGSGGNPTTGFLRRSVELKNVFSRAETKALGEFNNILRPEHLLVAVLEEPTPLLTRLLDDKEPVREQQESGSPRPVKGAESSAIVNLTALIKELRTKLLDQIYGQDHAIHGFVEGLFSAEILAEADASRRSPKAIFVFVGPPGVGKTFLAETGAAALQRPFKRFDMSSYSDNLGAMLLQGTQKSFHGAHEGLLTKFVKENPQSIILFDEIEKTHLSIIHLFLQILDHGMLEDKFKEENVSFKDTMIIFTTNAGKALYDNQNTSGINARNSSFHRKTILSALEQEKNPLSNEAVFPKAICSRLATGCLVMFNHLGVYDIERVVSNELRKTGELFAQAHRKAMEIGPAVPLCLILREGSVTDARAIKSQATSFVKTEIFKLCALNTPERMRTIFGLARSIDFQIDDSESMSDEIKNILEFDRKPSIFLVTRHEIAHAWKSAFDDIALTVASDQAEALNLIATRDFDFILIDLWFDNPPPSSQRVSLNNKTIFLFDYIPLTARDIRGGMELLRAIHERFPNLPRYMLSFRDFASNFVDEELMLACARAGGARESLETSFLSDDSPMEAKQETRQSLYDISLRLYRERKARELGESGSILAFDTAPGISAGKNILIKLRNFRISKAVAADDAGDILSDVERPAARFADVFGASQAKAELGFIIKWLKNPRQFRDSFIKAPKGILLHGPPGTGKTFLARALAGECKATFIVESATNFVTKWVGSGPENIRNLFARARRYAPAILFIDEIDAIGRKRTSESHSRPQEETLNALLVEMDGFTTGGDRPVIVLAATNLEESLDEALLRRFDRSIEVDKPDKPARQTYLESRLQGSDTRQVSDLVVRRLAGQSTGMTIADLERIVQMAARRAVEENGVIDDHVIEDAFETARMGEKKNAADPATLLRVARHEAGHCLIGWLLGERPVQVTIVARGKAGGYVEREAEEERMLYSRRELEGMIRQAMGGRAAEIVCYGEEEGLSTGASGDLQNAMRWAELMIREWGMCPEFGQVALSPHTAHDGQLAAKLTLAADGIISAQLKIAVADLRGRRQALDILVDRLLEKNRLPREELDEILGGIAAQSNLTS